MKLILVGKKDSTQKYNLLFNSHTVSDISESGEIFSDVVIRDRFIQSTQKQFAKVFSMLLEHSRDKLKKNEEYSKPTELCRNFHYFERLTEVSKVLSSL